MEQQLMRELQRSSDSVWSLPTRASTTLRIGPGPRVLRVCEGRLWLTTSGTAREASIDVWLMPGDSVELADGLSVVMEGWPGARFQLLVPPAACRTAWHAPMVLARAAAWLLNRTSTLPARAVQRLRSA
jgi:hypothetical protein